MATKITNYEESKQYLTKAEIDSYETMKTFATPQLLKTFEKELVKSANKRQKEENALREKSIKLIQLFQELFNIESVSDVEKKMRELATGEETVEEIPEEIENVEDEVEEEISEDTEEEVEEETEEDTEEDKEDNEEDLIEIDDFENTNHQFHW